MSELTHINATAVFQTALANVTRTSTISNAQSYKCGTCNDTGYEFIGDGVRPCVCLTRKRVERLLSVEWLQCYRRFDLAMIQPDPQRHWKQSALLDQLRREPERSYAFFGTNGIGKTLFAWLLYRYAVEDGRFAVAVKVKRLLDDFRAAEFDPDHCPAITARTLIEAKSRWLVLLDDFGVASPSAYAGSQLYDLCDAIYTKGHQLVVTSHSTAESLQRHWSQAGDRYGAAIMRRVLEVEGMVQVTELFNGERERTS